MLRWWSELRNPTLKCARVGHAKPYIHDGVGFMLAHDVPKHMVSAFDRAVAYRVEMSVARCSRCLAGLEPPKVTKLIRSIQRLSMAQCRWDLIDEQGYVWDS